MDKKINTNFLLLSPILTIKNSHLNKNDVRNIKYSLLQKICFTGLITSIIIFLVSLASLIFMGIETGWNQIEVYGLPSILGQIISITGTVCTILFSLISLFSKNEIIKNRFAHIANLLIFIIMSSYFFLSFYADVRQGFLSTSPSISPAIALIPFFLMIQSSFWLEAAILDGFFSLGVIGSSIYFSVTYNMQSLMYYILIAVFFPVACYAIISILFYAETQRYCEELRSETLHNTANYDELTHCKNRRALKQKIEDNSKNTIIDGNLILAMMFDIDDFKLYNDQFSHIGGDYCLRAIADSIKTAYPSLTLDLYRYGGEEFLLFLEVENQEQAEVEIERVRKAVENLKIAAPKGAPCDIVTISVGGALTHKDEVFDLNELIKQADKNLYKAKGSGKNVCVIDGKIIGR